MADVVRGKLVWEVVKGKKIRKVIHPKKSGGMTQPTYFDREQLAPDLRSRTEEEIEVDLELPGGKPVRIRPVDAGWVEEATPAAKTPLPAPRRESQDLTAQRTQPRPTQEQRMPGEFHNPYNFVPAPPREPREARPYKFDDVPPGGLGDEPPAGHHRYHEERYSGTIRVNMTVETPLLIPDAAQATDDGAGHKTFPVRVDANDRPYLAPTSIKGMLRAAFEAVTNSRMGVFHRHDDPLAFRMEANDALRTVPARVQLVENEVRVYLFTGESEMEDDGSPKIIERDASGGVQKRDPMFAAWLNRHVVKKPHVHNQKVWAYITLCHHQSPHFDFWHVEEIQDWTEDKPPENPPGHWVAGYTCVTKKNIKRKHDERVFFYDQAVDQLCITLRGDQISRWKLLVDDYRAQHEDSPGKLKPDPKDDKGKQLKWSRHIYEAKKERDLEKLTTGLLCYAIVRKNGVSWELTDLIPVMISRRLHAASPANLLHSHHLPATNIEKLSPADRVFGWVNQTGTGAYRGNLRVGAVRCESVHPILEFSPPLPLAILSSPKPQQSRFYVAKDQTGAAQASQELSREAAGYTHEKGLRGRKVYPHHTNLPSDYWHLPTAGDPTQQLVNQSRHFREYPRPAGTRDDQNRSIKGWVKPGTTFAFDLHVTNLSPVELGALTWLLSLGPDHFHRFGGGKPLGFGSVHLAIDQENTRVCTGAAWQEWYASLDAAVPSPCDLGVAEAAYKAELGNAAIPFEEVPFIKAFLRACRGFDDGLPTHYPRARQPDQKITDPVPPHPDGLAYEWFVSNDKKGARYALGNLATDTGLPILNAPKKGSP
jgi:CRISPR-associated protein (TIGR03986 family)